MSQAVPRDKSLDHEIVQPPGTQKGYARQHCLESCSKEVIYWSKSNNFIKPVPCHDMGGFSHCRTICYSGSNNKLCLRFTFIRMAVVMDSWEKRWRFTCEVA